MKNKIRLKIQKKSKHFKKYCGYCGFLSQCLQSALECTVTLLSVDAHGYFNTKQLKHQIHLNVHPLLPALNTEMQHFLL